MTTCARVAVYSSLAVLLLLGAVGCCVGKHQQPGEASSLPDSEKAFEKDLPSNEPPRLQVGRALQVPKEALHVEVMPHAWHPFGRWMPLPSWPVPHQTPQANSDSSPKK